MTAGRLSPLFSWRSAICDSDLTSTQRHVALTLSLHMSERGDSCFPANSTLAAETGLADSTVRAALAVLVEAGWLAKTERRRPDGGKTSSEWQALTPPPSVGDGGPPPVGDGDRRESAVSPPPVGDQEDVKLERQSEDVPPAAPTADQIARELVTGYWEWVKARQGGRDPVLGYMALVGIVKPLIVAGWEPAAVKHGLVAMFNASRSLSRQSLEAELRRHGTRRTDEDRGGESGPVAV